MLLQFRRTLKLPRTRSAADAAVAAAPGGNRIAAHRLPVWRPLIVRMPLDFKLVSGMPGALFGGLFPVSTCTHVSTGSNRCLTQNEPHGRGNFGEKRVQDHTV